MIKQPKNGLKYIKWGACLSAIAFGLYIVLKVGSQSKLSVIGMGLIIAAIITLLSGGNRSRTGGGDHDDGSYGGSDSSGDSGGGDGG